MGGKRKEKLDHKLLKDIKTGAMPRRRIKSQSNIANEAFVIDVKTYKMLTSS